MKAFPPQVQFAVTLALVGILLALVIVVESRKVLKKQGPLFESNKRLQKKIESVDSLQRIMTDPQDAQILAKRKQNLERKIETRQLRDQFREYADERLKEADAETAKLFKPKKFFAFAYYMVATLLYTALLLSTLRLLTYPKGFTPLAVFHKTTGMLIALVVVILGVLVCFGIKKAWQRSQVNFAFRTYLLPLISSDNKDVANQEQAAFDKMVDARKSSAPKVGFLAPVSGILTGIAAPIYTMCIYHLQFFPTNMFLLLFGTVFMVIWFYGLIYFCVSALRYMFRKSDCAY
ncbi:hypothetical protein OZX62_03105 [Bifidobacterium sp. ESL0690]|uniref:hypothetical protein n=1 Tax=Bifidobacterium sp. ESL0690 TaxID=2983214 RepID=UPI0023F68527|nr:hypothetical protein [Bifidobacterium sp. ESL0690]WEV47284.1 hypothetical protein OZX62_03105 [Bifidobacterium sp. ESL0690]